MFHALNLSHFRLTAKLQSDRIPPNSLISLLQTISDDLPKTNIITNVLQCTFVLWNVYYVHNKLNNVDVKQVDTEVRKNIKNSLIWILALKNCIRSRAVPGFKPGGVQILPPPPVKILPPLPSPDEVGVQKSSISNHCHPNVFSNMRAPQLVISTKSIGNQTKKSVTLKIVYYLEISPYWPLLMALRCTILLKLSLLLSFEKNL